MALQHSSSESAENRSHDVVGAVSFLLPLVTLLVGLRFYTRGVILKSIWADDWTTLVALVSTDRYARNISHGITDNSHARFSPWHQVLLSG